MGRAKFHVRSIEKGKGIAYYKNKNWDVDLYGDTYVLTAERYKWVKEWKVEHLAENIYEFEHGGATYDENGDKRVKNDK